MGAHLKGICPGVQGFDDPQCHVSRQLVGLRPRSGIDIYDRAHGMQHAWSRLASPHYPCKSPQCPFKEVCCLQIAVIVDEEVHLHALYAS